MTNTERLEALTELHVYAIELGLGKSGIAVRILDEIDAVEADIEEAEAEGAQRVARLSATFARLEAQLADMWVEGAR